MTEGERGTETEQHGFRASQYWGLPLPRLTANAAERWKHSSHTNGITKAYDITFVSTGSGVKDSTNHANNDKKENVMLFILLPLVKGRLQGAECSERTLKE